MCILYMFFSQLCISKYVHVSGPFSKANLTNVFILRKERKAPGTF